jgi:hypothetical protein
MPLASQGVCDVEGAGPPAREFVVHKGKRPEPFQPPPVPEDLLGSMPEHERAALPNLIVIGAGKCGTSALHDYLGRHPDIGMSTTKEVQLFGGNRWLERLPSYPSFFDASKPVRGESSPSYTLDPFIPRVPEQMVAVLPDPRFIYLVADPVKRVVAHWSEQSFLTLDRRWITEALEDAEDPLNPYVGGSRYGHQLQRYIDVFGADRVLVVDQRDLRGARRDTLRAVFEFAGVDPDFWCDDFDAELINSAADKREPNAVGRWMESTFGPRAVKVSRVRFVTGRRLRRPELDDATRARVSAALAPDIAHFRELTGRPFAHWPV